MDKTTRNYRAGQLGNVGKKKSIYGIHIQVRDEFGKTNNMLITGPEYEEIKKILTAWPGGIENNLKKGDELVQECGCSFTVLDVTRVGYKLQHTDESIVSWSNRKMDELIKSGELIIRRAGE